MNSGTTGQKLPHSVLVNNQGIVIYDKLGYDGNCCRYLVLGDSINGDVQGIKNLSKPKFHLQQFTKHLVYAAVLAHPILRPSNALFLGLGAGIAIDGVSSFFPSTEIHVVDVNEHLFEYTHKYFYPLNRPNMHLYHQDANDYIVNSSREFDMVFCDLFGADLALPAFLLQDEFYDKIKNMGARLFVINSFAQISKTLYEILTKKYKYVISLTGHNAFLICSDEFLHRDFGQGEIETLHEMNIFPETIVGNSVLLRKLDTRFFNPLQFD